MPARNTASSTDQVAKAPTRPSRLKRLMISLLRIVVLGYATVLVALVLMEKRMVFPGAYMEIPPVKTAGVQTVQYESSDGIALKGQLCERDDAQHVVLFLHGNGISAARESDRVAHLARELNANVLAAEYRGFDGLNGSPSEGGVIQDSLAARDYLCEKYQIQPKELIVYGQSLGGGCATAVAASGGAKLLMLDRTFDRSVDVGAEMFWFIPVRLLMRNRFDSVARLSQYDGPLVQWHGTADKVIPIKHARRLHESSPSQPKHWIEISGMGHNDRCPDSAWQECKAKILDCLNNASADLIDGQAER